MTTGYNHVVLLGAVTGGPWHNPGGEGKAAPGVVARRLMRLSGDNPVTG